MAWMKFELFKITASVPITVYTFHKEQLVDWSWAEHMKDQIKNIAFLVRSNSPIYVQQLFLVGKLMTASSQAMSCRQQRWILHFLHNLSHTSSLVWFALVQGIMWIKRTWMCMCSCFKTSEYSKSSVAEVQFQTGRTKQTVWLWFQFWFRLKQSVLVRSSGIRKNLRTAFELVQTKLNRHVLFIFFIKNWLRNLENKLCLWRLSVFSEF